MVFTTKALRILTTKNTKVTKKILDTNRRSSYIPADDISKDVLDCAFHVYKKMGIGLLESVYEECLCYAFSKRNISFERQKSIPVFMDGEPIGIGFKADIVIDGTLILEIKSVDRLTDIHSAQLMNYMRLSGIKTGLLINFNEALFKNGVKRFVI